MDEEAAVRDEKVDIDFIYRKKFAVISPDLKDQIGEVPGHGLVARAGIGGVVIAVAALASALVCLRVLVAANHQVLNDSSYSSLVLGEPDRMYVHAEEGSGFALE